MKEDENMREVINLSWKYFFEGWKSDCVEIKFFEIVLPLFPKNVSQSFSVTAVKLFIYHAVVFADKDLCTNFVVSCESNFNFS